jgi:hypothetical protein
MNQTRSKLLVLSILAAMLAVPCIAVSRQGQPSSDGSPKSGATSFTEPTPPPSDARPVIEILIQDNLISRVDNEIKGLKDLIRTLPEGSSVLTGYITTGTLNVTQDFTTDRNRAAGSLRILRGASAAPYNPYIELIEGLKRFDSQPQGRRVVLLVSDGVDLSHGFSDANPSQSMDLNRSIREAQQRGVSVSSIFAPEIGLGGHSLFLINFGQGCLNKLADKTGGKSYNGTNTFVSFDPYIKAFRATFGGK